MRNRWSEHLALDHGEINLDLIGPAGMDRRGHEDGIWAIGPTRSDPLHCLFAAMSRALVHDPEDALGRLRVLDSCPQTLADRWERYGFSSHSDRTAWRDRRPRPPN